MQKFLKKSPTALATFLGFIFLFPFVALEIINRHKFNEGFPVSIFIFTGVLQSAFILILLPIINNIRSRKSLTKNPITFLLQIVGLVIIASIWGGWIMDQWPCLMGVPNCD